MTEQPPESFADVLNRQMAQRGVSQARLAAELGTYDANVARWRKGRGITPQNAAAIADYFKLDRGYMLGLAGYPDNSVSSTEVTVDPEISAMLDAERDELHAVLNGIPKIFWRTILGAQRAARALALQNVEDARQISSETSPDLAPPPGPAPEKDQRTRKPRSPRFTGHLLASPAH